MLPAIVGLAGPFVEESSDVLGNWVAQSVSWVSCGGVEDVLGNWVA